MKQLSIKKSKGRHNPLHRNAFQDLCCWKCNKTLCPNLTPQEIARKKGSTTGLCVSCYRKAEGKCPTCEGVYMLSKPRTHCEHLRTLGRSEWKAFMLGCTFKETVDK